MFVNVFNTDRKYTVIYADPPWTFQTYGEGGKGRSAERHYPCMTKGEIQKLPIPDLCERDCILFLWVTFPCLLEGLELIKKWGFKYKTCAFVWVKKNRKSPGWFWGLGYWTRSNAELCLLATKGNPKRASKSVHQVVDDAVMEHSRKPDEVMRRIERLCGDVPRIELFARRKVDRWDCWGNEVALEDEPNVPTEGTHEITRETRG